MLIFFLNLRFHYNDVEYRHRYHNSQHISIRKNPCFMVYMTASPAEATSVMSGLRVQFSQPSRLYLSGSCMKSYQTLMCFLSITCLRLFVLSFQDPGYALGLCARFIADTNPREPCVSRRLEVGITFLILSCSKAKWQKCLSCGAITHSGTIFF